MVVLWNPSVRKCVGIPIPNVLYSPEGYTRIAFGVCRDTNDPKLVKINVIKTPSRCWDVHVFTLSSSVWKTVYTGVPFKSCDLFSGNFFIDGIIYWRSRGSFLISFDLKSEKFGEVCLPDKLAISSNMKVVKVNESIGLLEYYKEGEMWVCGVSRLQRYIPSRLRVSRCSLKYWGLGTMVKFYFNRMMMILKGLKLKSMNPRQDVLIVLGLVERILCSPCGRTWKHYFCLMSQILSFIDSEDGLQSVRIKL
ncbi:putative pentatricopeptide repeat-containing protein [Tanacetum coccineum]